LTSWFPFDDFDGDRGVLSHKRLRNLHFGGHLPQLLQRLLELFTGRRVLGAGSNQLHRVELSLVVQIIQELDDLIELVKVIDLNLALLELGERCQGTHSASTYLIDLVGQHVAERWDRLSFNRGTLAHLIVANRAKALSRQLPDLPVRRCQV